MAHLLPEEQVYLNQQSGTIRLDCFTHCLIVKCAPDITLSRVPSPSPARSALPQAAPDADPSLSLPPVAQFIDTLLGTLVKELQNKYTPGRREEAIDVTMRFLRSVARVFVILSVEMASSKKKK